MILLPANLDLDEHLKQFPPEGIKNFKRKHLEYTIGQIYRVSLLSDSNNNGYTQINHRQLQRHIRNAKEYIDYCINTKIWISDYQYIKKVKSIGYKFNTKYSGRKKSTCEFKFKNNDENYEIKQTLLETHSYLTKWFNDKLTFDDEGAYKEIANFKTEQKGYEMIIANDINAIQNYKENYMSTCINMETAIEYFKNKEFIFQIDLKGYRFHSILTRLNKRLRRFIKYDGRVLYSFDIVNCQPYLSICLLKKDFYEFNNEKNISNIYSQLYVCLQNNLNF